jgi:hypothetical protein
MNRGTLFIAGSLLLLLVYVAVRTNADTLFKDKTAVAIGHGTAEKDKVHWADCSDGNKKDYDKPPYWVDKADNCKLNPHSFGLQVKDGKYVVSDEEQFKKFFPKARAGDEATFRITDKSLELGHGGKTLRLLR